MGLRAVEGCWQYRTASEMPNEKEAEFNVPKIGVSLRIREEIYRTLATYAANERRSVSNLMEILMEWSLVELQKRGGTETLLGRKISAPRRPDGNYRRGRTTIVQK